MRDLRKQMLAAVCLIDVFEILPAYLLRIGVMVKLYES